MEVADSPGAGELLRRLGAAIARHGVLRVKGFAHVPGKDMRLLIQAVGDRIQHYYDRNWRDGEERRTRLVVIGHKGLDERLGQEPAERLVRHRSGPASAVPDERCIGSVSSMDTRIEPSSASRSSRSSGRGHVIASHRACSGLSS